MRNVCDEGSRQVGSTNSGSAARATVWHLPELGWILLGAAGTETGIGVYEWIGGTLLCDPYVPAPFVARDLSG